MTLFVRVAGADVTESVVIENARFAMQTGPNPGDFLVQVKDPQKTFAFRAGQSIEADFAGYPIFDGYVTKAVHGFFFPVQDVTDPGTVTKGWTLTGVDINILLQKRVTFNQASPDQPISLELPAGTSDLVWVNQILDNLTIADDNLTPVIQTVASPNPDQPGIGVSIGDEWADDMARISSMTGAVWGIRSSSSGRFDAGGFDSAFAGSASNRQRIFYYEDDTSITAPFAISDTPDGVSSFGYSNFEWTEDATRMVNDAKVWGAGPGSPITKYTEVVDDDSIADHGRWEGAEFRSDLFRQTSVDRYADSLVYGSPSHAHGPKDPSISVKCRVVRPGLLAGQKVRIISDVYGDDTVLPIRKLESTFVNRDEALFDLVATWDIDGPRGLYDDWTIPTGDDLPGGEPIDETTDPNPCVDLGLLIGDGSSWSLVRSDPRLGSVDAAALGITSNFNTINKARYWQQGGFFKGDGQDASETYAIYSKPLPFQPTQPATALPAFGFTMQFQAPVFSSVPSFHSYSANPAWGPTTIYPQFALTVSFTTGSFGFIMPGLQVLRVEQGNIYVGGHLDPTGNFSLPVAQGSWWNLERAPSGDIRIWDNLSSRPENPTGIGIFGPGVYNLQHVGRLGVPAPGNANDGIARIFIGFETWEAIGEFSTDVLIHNAPGDPSNEMTLLDRFLDETWCHDRLPEFLGHSVYTYADGVCDPSDLIEGYHLTCAIQKPTIALAENVLLGTMPLCYPDGVEAVSGEYYCETPDQISSTEYATKYAFTPGSSSVEVGATHQRLDEDYTEDPAGQRINFIRDEVPTDSSVYVCYEALV